MNLAVLKKTRRAPEPGDLFVMQPPDEKFLFGRVISTDANPLGVGGGILPRGASGQFGEVGSI